MKMNEGLLREMNLHKIIKEQELTIERLTKRERELSSLETEVVQLRDIVSQTTGKIMHADDIKKAT